MTYCTLEEAWNLSDNDDNELEYNNYQSIDDNYFDSPTKNKKELDFQNHEIEITRNKNNKINRMETNFNTYDQMEQNNLKNRKANNDIDKNISPNNLLNSNYHFLEDDLNNKNIEEHVESENIEDKEFFTSKNNDSSNKQISNIDLKVHEKLLINIMERLDTIDKKLSTKKEERNNIHDIILFIVIGIFILFALDSIFRIGRMTI